MGIGTTTEEPTSRAYAALGSVSIATSLLWFWTVEGRDLTNRIWSGAGICLVRAALILFGPRAMT